MSNYYEIGKIIDNILNVASKEELTIWLIEEETGEAVKLYDMLNSEKYAKEAIFKRVK